MVNRIKDTLNIDPETIIVYKKIKKECHDLRLTYLQIFKLAIAVGYSNFIRKPLEKKHRFIRINNSDVDFNSLVYLIAVDELDIEQSILNDDPSEIYELAEQYANAGIQIIEDKFIGEYDFYSRLEEILQLCDENELIDSLNMFK